MPANEEEKVIISLTEKQKGVAHIREGGQNTIMSTEQCQKISSEPNKQEETEIQFPYF